MNDEHHFPFQTLRLVDARKRHSLGVAFFAVRADRAFGFERRDQRQLREKLRRVRVLPGVVRQDVQFLPAALVVRELRLGIVIVNRLDHALDGARGRDELPARRDFFERVDELLPHLLAFRADLRPEKRVGKRIDRLVFRQRLFKVRPEFVRRRPAHSRQQTHDALERHLVVVVRAEFQERRHVLDMRLLEKPQAACDLKRDTVPGQFDLQLQRVEMRAVEHGDLVEFDALVAQFEDALGDELRLHVAVVEFEQRGLDRARLPVRRQLLGKLLLVRLNGGIGHLEDFRHAAVIGLDLVRAGRRITPVELEDVFEIRPAPGIDRLRVVADDHDVLVLRGEQVHELGLDVVGVLVLLTEHELELPLVDPGDFLVLGQQFERLGEQVVEIHRVRGLLLALVQVVDRLELFDLIQKVRILGVDDVPDRARRVHRHAENVGHDFRLRKTFLLRVDPGGGDDCLHQVFLILAVHDGKPAPPPQHLRVPPQNLVADGVERPAPEPLGAVGQE